MKSIEKLLDALVNERVVRDVIVPVRELRFCGKLSVENQIGGFGVGALFRQFFDRVAAVSQDSLVAIDEGSCSCRSPYSKTPGRNSSSRNQLR